MVSSKAPPRVGLIVLTAVVTSGAEETSSRILEACFFFSLRLDVKDVFDEMTALFHCSVWGSVIHLSRATSQALARKKRNFFHAQWPKYVILCIF